MSRVALSNETFGSLQSPPPIITYIDPWVQSPATHCLPFCESALHLPPGHPESQMRITQQSPRTLWAEFRAPSALNPLASIRAELRGVGDIE